MTTPNAGRLGVEVWTDPQCIWCYITHPRLEAAIAAHGGEIDVVYRSFHLHPEACVEIDRDEHIRAHSGGMSAADRDRIIAQLTDLAAAEGLDHRPDLVQPTNSALALELLHHADTLGQRDVLIRRLAHAHFAEGRNIGRLDQLLQIATAAGIDTGPAEQVLTSRVHRAAVHSDTARARSLGAKGVPFYADAQGSILGGAHTTEALLYFLQGNRRPQGPG